MNNAEQVQNIMLGATELSKEQRTAYLEAACRGDTALRAEVESLLDSHDRAGRFLAGTSDLSATAPESVARKEDAFNFSATLREGPGTRIGPYKILQMVGEGGFGSVFMAEQERPVLRKVALKIIKLGMDTRQVIARFEAERQALAMMDHPNIARVLDAGATESGRPFFVMELVKGDPIVEYCDKNNLSIEDRLELFAQVCNAVQHAHTKGIIHRDIKPSNILVSTLDGRPHTKVIDFGIAKATASKLTDKTLFTEHRQLIGTPEYMSPEQAEGSLDIDTRTDVYSLGVLLYELLTGTTPFTGNQLRSAAYAEIQRIIREVEPPKPSTRLSANTDTLARVAAKRHTEPRKLGTLVRGELDWIVMKALEKDRQRRYETSNGLMMDIRRYLAGEAIVAAPVSTMYRLRKFVRRKKGTVIAGSAVASALLIGVVAFAWQAKVASSQRDIAVTAQKAEAEQRQQADTARAEAQKQEAEAKKQAAIAEEVAKFQTDMLAAVNPDKLPKDPVTKEPLKDKLTVVQAVQAAVTQLDGGSLKDQPLVEAGVRDTIGNTLRGLGRYDEAEPNLRRSLALRRAALPAGDSRIATGVNDLAVLLRDQNRAAEAEPLFREALAIDRSNLAAGHPDIATDLNNLAVLLKDQDKLAEAEPLYREALAIRRATLPAGHPEIGASLNNLALLLLDQNQLAEAEKLQREALGIYRAALPEGHPDIAAALSGLAMLLSAGHQPAEAEPLSREALDILRRALPAGHPKIALGLNNLASLVQDQSKFSEAEPLYLEALAIRRAALPPGHPDIARSLNNLAWLLREENKLDEAEPLFREALSILRSAFPAGHPDTASAMNGLAMLLKAQNKLDEAEALYRGALAINRKTLPAGHPNIVAGLNGLAWILQDQNKLVEAEPLIREVTDIRRRILPAGHLSVATSLSNHARVQQRLGETAQARAEWDEAIAIFRKTSPDGSALLARALGHSGSARLENGDPVAALPELEESVKAAEKFLPANDPQLKECRNTLARCKAALAQQGQATLEGGKR